MAETSTPLLLSSLPEGRRASTPAAGGCTVAEGPRPATLAFLRQLARCYTAIPGIATVSGLAGVIAN